MGIYGEDYQPHVWCRISEPTTVVSKRLGSPPLRKAMKGRSRGSHNLILFDLLTGMILQGFSMTPKLPDWMESPRNICLNIWGVAPNRSLWWRDSRWNIYHFSGTASIYGDFQQMTWLDAQTIPKPINWVYPTMISCFHGIRVFGIHEMLIYFAWTIWNQYNLGWEAYRNTDDLFFIFGYTPENEHKVMEVWFRWKSFSFEQLRDFYKIGP